MSLFFPPDDPKGDDPTDPRDQSDVQSPGRRSSMSKRGRVLAISMTCIAVVVLLTLGAGTVYVGTIDRSINRNLHRTAGELPAEIPPSTDEAPRPSKGTSKAMNFVIMGSDSRDTSDAGQGRSDVLMVAHLNADRHGASVISFPRDMYIPIPGHGTNKINAAYAYGGTQLTIRTLEGMLHTRMDHVALIDFTGFIQLTDDLGGVTVNNTHYSDSQGYKFPVGKVTIKGAQALAYVRERHQLPRGDLDRAERQRLVVQAIMRKGMSEGMIADPIAFNRFVSEFAQQVTVDDELSSSELRKTALSLRFSPDDIHLMQAPISGFGTSSDGQSIDVVDQKKLKELGKALHGDTMSDYLDKYPNG